jgi:hypothetical protein
MVRILKFGDFDKVESATFRLKQYTSTDDEIIFEGILNINGEKSNGYIFCDKSGDLECYQFFDKDGRDIGETYGPNIIENIVKQKIKNKIKKIFKK